MMKFRIINRAFYFAFLITCCFASRISYSTEREELKIQDVAKEYKETVARWDAFISDPRNIDNPTDSRGDSYVNNKPFDEIVALGVPALEYIVQDIESGKNLIDFAFKRISKKQFTNTEMWQPGGYDAAIIRWWRNGRANIKEEFAAYYEQWTKTPQGKEKDTRFKTLVGVSVLALPYAMEHLKEGNEQLMPAIDYWTDNKPKEAFEKLEGEEMSKKDFYLAWWEKNKDFWLVPQLKKPAESKE